MKKTIPITLSGILFHIEEDAYPRLAAYLDSIRAHFATHPNKDEIITDIENRVSEQFVENNTSNNKERIVTLANVETLIASMGTIEDFNEAEGGRNGQSDSTSNSGTNSSNASGTSGGKSQTQRKLFRNPDDIMVAGVSSGIAAYFGIDATIIRIIFVAIVFFGGSGVIIYLILWFFMPLAKTPAEKLQMRGEPVTLDSMNGMAREMIKEKVEEVKKNKGVFRKIVAFPFIVIRTVVGFIFPLIARIIGGVISFFAGIALVGSTVLVCIVLFNGNSPYIDFPLLEMGHTVAVYAALAAGWFVVFVPLLFILWLGVKLASKKNIFSSVGVVSLMAIWFTAITITGVLGTGLAVEYQHFVATDPRYQQTVTEFTVADFQNIEAKNGSRITVTPGPEFSVVAHGTVASLEEMLLTSTDNTLHVARSEHFKICIFCWGNTPELTVTMPVLKEVTAENASRITVIDATSTANSATFLADLTVRLQNGSNATFTGTSTITHIFLENGSHFNGEGLVIQNAFIDAQNGSVAELYATKTLTATLENGSRVLYTGNPVISKTLKNGSTLRSSEPEKIEEVDSQDY